MSILPDAETFRRLADGTLRGPGPCLARCLLGGLALPYGLVTAARNAAYDRGVLRMHAGQLPVISVGNLTLGGTGKTPLVAWLARRLAARGFRPAIVSRGYASRPHETSDEAAELAILLPGVPHVADRDRVAGVTTAAGRGADVAVLDDGFQHRRLRRDLDIVAIDASDPFGCGYLFPRGLLRESLGGLARADAVVLTRAKSALAARRQEIRAVVEQARCGRPPLIWVEAEHRPVALRASAGTVEPLDRARGRRVAAFCGIGNPAAFRRTLVDTGLGPVGFRSFADHHAYGPADLEALATWARQSRAELVVTTLKDLVKIRRDRLGDLPLVALEVALEPLGDAEPLAVAIEQAAARGGSAA
ncbi:MAG: tetraacyldisaccharide 4'-kinase [Planctomycetota bacterium]